MKEKGFALVPVLALLGLAFPMILLSHHSLRLDLQVVAASQKPDPIKAPEPSTQAGFYLDENGFLLKNKLEPPTPLWGKLYRDLEQLDTSYPRLNTKLLQSFETGDLNLAGSRGRLVVFGSLKAKRLQLASTEQVEIIATGNIEIEQVSGSYQALLIYSSQGEVKIGEAPGPYSAWSGETGFLGPEHLLDPAFWPRVVALGRS